MQPKEMLTEFKIKSVLQKKKHANSCITSKYSCAKNNTLRLKRCRWHWTGKRNVSGVIWEFYFTAISYKCIAHQFTLCSLQFDSRPRSIQVSTRKTENIFHKLRALYKLQTFHSLTFPNTSDLGGVRLFSESPFSWSEFVGVLLSL